MHTDDNAMYPTCNNMWCKNEVPFHHQTPENKLTKDKWNSLYQSEPQWNLRLNGQNEYEYSLEKLWEQIQLNKSTMVVLAWCEA